MHANESSAQKEKKNMQAGYHCDFRPGDHWKLTSGNGSGFHHAKVTWKINIYAQSKHV